MPEFKILDWVKFDKENELVKKFDELGKKWSERQRMDFSKWYYNVRNVRENFVKNKGPVWLDIGPNYLYYADNLVAIGEIENDKPKKKNLEQNNGKQFIYYNLI